jgi:hypothetical protein
MALVRLAWERIIALTKFHRLKPAPLGAAIRFLCKRDWATGGIMTTSTSAPQMQTLGQYVQLAGIGSFVVGAILSVHHYAIGLCIIAGAAAFYIGKKMRGA